MANQGANSTIGNPTGYQYIFKYITLNLVLSNNFY